MTTLRSGLTSILNVDLSENQWTQASLPVGDGGLGIRSAQMLAPGVMVILLPKVKKSSRFMAV